MVTKAAIEKIIIKEIIYHRFKKEIPDDNFPLFLDVLQPLFCFSTMVTTLGLN